MTSNTTAKKRRALADLRLSQSCFHLSAYINTTNLSQNEIVAELERIIWQSENLLLRQWPIGKAKSFLNPIRNLVQKPEMLMSKGAGCWGLFRSSKAFLLKKLPVYTPSFSVIADSFHIKPILKAAQAEMDSYILVLSKTKVGLYRASLTGLRCVGQMNRHTSNTNTHDMLSKYLWEHATVDWIDDWLNDVVENLNIPLLLIGSKDDIELLRNESNYPNILHDAVEQEIDVQDVANIRRALHSISHQVEKKHISRILKQLQRASVGGMAEFDLHRVALQAAQRNIARLYIAEDQHIWGLLNRKNGTFILHPKQKDCFDDDILDDLAELVLQNGGEVALLPQSQMPNQAQVAAILKSRASKYSKARLSIPGFTL
tara:strand:- start:24863 stop:25981 length:1119 start_codon:yes stop_codon:yes gene_type:complete